MAGTHLGSLQSTGTQCQLYIFVFSLVRNCSYSSFFTNDLLFILLFSSGQGISDGRVRRVRQGRQHHQPHLPHQPVLGPSAGHRLVPRKEGESILHSSFLNRNITQVSLRCIFEKSEMAPYTFHFPSNFYDQNPGSLSTSILSSASFGKSPLAPPLAKTTDRTLLPQEEEEKNFLQCYKGGSLSERG